MTGDLFKAMKLLQSVCALLVVVAVVATIGAASSEQHRQLLEKLQGGDDRAYGVLPSRIPYLTEVSARAEELATYDPQDLAKKPCGNVIIIKNFYVHEFKITPETKFCAAVLKPMPGSKLSINNTKLNLKECHKEYLMMADDAALQQMYCGLNNNTDFFDGLDVLLLQYERAEDTSANFTVSVFSKPEDIRSVSGRALETYSADTSDDIASYDYQICPYTCGSASPLTGSGRVLGGSDAVHGEYPWMVRIMFTVKASDGSFVPASCGGSILDRFHVLTAAHCLFSNRTSSIKVIVGSLDTDSVQHRDCIGTCFKAIKGSYSPVFNPNSGTYYGDIAVLLLNRPITFGPLVAPVCLPPHLPFTNSMLTLTSFGYFKNKKFPSRLQEVTVTAKEHSECEQEFERIQFNYTLESSQICVNEIWKNACNKDSGAPAVINLNGRYYQVGIVSFGLPCDEKSKRFFTHTSVYTRLSYYSNFIRRILNGTESC